MPVTLSWEQVAIRILLASIASFLIGYNRDERGKAMGLRSTMLVCLAATLAMLQANLLMNSTGKAPNSFVVLDLMRLPLGILSGIGFIGAGAILRKDGLVHGVTTAATIWFVTVLGLIFGGGQIRLALTGTALALLILWGLKRLEMRMPTHRSGGLAIEFASGLEKPTEDELFEQLRSSGLAIQSWKIQYRDSALQSIECELKWSVKGRTLQQTPEIIHNLSHLSSIASLVWHE